MIETCKHCGSFSYVKNGIVHGRQRYRCRECQKNFTNAPPRGKPAAMKADAVLMYTSGSSLSGIAKKYNVSVVAVLKWVRAAAQALPEIPCETTSTEKSAVIIMDEMHHFVNGKKNSCGFGKPSVRSLAP